MIYTANTGCFKLVKGSEDFFLASRLSESMVISIKVVVDSITDTQLIQRPSYPEQFQAFLALNQSSLAAFLNDGEDYSDW